MCVEPDAKSRTGASMRTLAEERGHAVVAGGAVVTSGAGAVVDVLAAVVTRPAVDADAVVAAVSVVARPSVLAGVGHQLALVDIFRTVLTCKTTVRLKGDSTNKLFTFYLRSKIFKVTLMAKGYLCNEVGTGSCRCSRRPHTRHRSGSCGLDSHRCYAHSADQ